MLLLTLPIAAALALPQDPAGRVIVLDGETGAPIAGAAVHGVAEVTAPVWGEFWSTAAAAPTDAQGRTELPPSTDEAKYHWTIVRAAGYAPAGVSTGPRLEAELEVKLWPVIPAELRVLDFQGRPAPLVHLGVAVGCGHTPDAASAVTDRDGQATLLAVGEEHGIADVFPVGDRVRTTYLDVDWEAAKGGSFETVVMPGGRVDGIVLDPAGRPLPGVGVGRLDTHRGPWAVTGEDGRFTLFGVDPEVCDYLEVRDMAGNGLGWFEQTRVGVERVLRLPPGRMDDERVGPTGPLEVKVGVVGGGAGEVPVLVWDTTTGWLTRDSVPPGETARFELHDGNYAVRVGGMGSGFETLHLGRVDAGPTHGEPVLRATLAPVEERRLEVADVGEATGLKVISASGEERRLAFDRLETDPESGVCTGVVERFRVGDEPFGLWLEPRTERRSMDPVDLEPRPSDPGAPLRGRRRP